MQAARDLVGLVVELAAGVEDGEDHLEGGHVALLGVLVHGDAAAVVHDRDGVVRVNVHEDLGAVACQGLVHGVVHDLVHQVVQAAGTRRANVHARALADRFEAFEDFDLIPVVSIGLLRFSCHQRSFRYTVLGCRSILLDLVSCSNPSTKWFCEGDYRRTR